MKLGRRKKGVDTTTRETVLSALNLTQGVLRGLGRVLYERGKELDHFLDQERTMIAIGARNLGKRSCNFVF